jgi:hypothetical protein
VACTSLWHFGRRNQRRRRRPRRWRWRRWGVELLEDEELAELLDLKVDYDKLMVAPHVEDWDTLLEV